MNRIHRAFLALLCLLAVRDPARAEPGDTHTAFSSRAPNSFPGYSQIPAFADQISGTATSAGYQSAAFRVTAESSGPIEKVLVVLYPAPTAGTEGSAKIVLYSDANGEIGGKLREFIIDGITPNVFSGYFGYHPEDTSLILNRGRTYWIGVEPLRENSFVYWAQADGGPLVKKMKDTGGNVKYEDDRFHADFVILDCFEPAPPTIVKAGVPLIETLQVPGEPNGTKLNSLGVVPQAPLLGKLDVSRAKVPAILGADGKVVLRAGQAAPGLDGTTITKLGEPSGDVVLATLKRQPTSGANGAITAANDAVLIGGLQTPPLHIVARTGAVPDNSEGAAIKSFGLFDGNGSSTFFTATLTSPKTNDSALIGVPANGTPRVLVREGDKIGDETVKSIATLVSAKGSAPEGRWRVDGNNFGVRLTFQSKRQRDFGIPVNAADASAFFAGDGTGVPLPAPLAGAEIVSLGLPAYGPDSTAVVAKLKVGVGGVTKANDTVLLLRDVNGLSVIARKGDNAPDTMGDALEATPFASFSDPVSGPGGQLAFQAKLGGVKNPAGIWRVDSAGMLRLVARAGDLAPGIGAFATFTTIVFPDSGGGGPIFQGSLKPEAAGSITAATKTGVWGVNATGDLKLIVRAGGFIYLNDDYRGYLKTISSLVTATGSPGAAHGVDGDGSVRVNATISNLATEKKSAFKAQFAVPVPESN